MFKIKNISTENLDFDENRSESNNSDTDRFRIEFSAQLRADFDVFCAFKRATLSNSSRYK